MSKDKDSPPFGFLDPSLVIHRCHLILIFCRQAYQSTIMKESISCKTAWQNEQLGRILCEHVSFIDFILCYQVYTNGTVSPTEMCSHTML